MLRIASLIGIVAAAIINLLPVSGVLGASWLKSLYGFDIIGADIEILLRHRAVFFGLIALLLLASIARPALRGAALLVAVVSMASIVIIALLVGNYGAAIHRVVIADILGLVALIPALIAHFFPPRSE